MAENEKYAHQMKILCDIYSEYKVGKNTYSLKGVLDKLKRDCNEDECEVLDLLMQMQKAGEVSFEKASMQQKESVSNLSVDDLKRGDFYITMSAYPYLTMMQLMVGMNENVKSSLTNQHEEMGKKEERLKNLQEKIKGFEKKVTEVEGKIDEEFNAALESNGLIGSALHSLQKDIIEYMAIFIAVFSLINLNLNCAGCLQPDNLVIANVSLLAAFVSLGAVLAYVMNKAADNGNKAEGLQSHHVLMLIGLVLWFLSLWGLKLLHLG